MTRQTNPITPPPELRQQWMTEARSQDYCSITEQVAFHAAQWGADQELKACRHWLEANGAPRQFIDGLLDARRPKPLSFSHVLIERMADELDHYRQLLRDDKSETHALAAEARAYLAQSEPQAETTETR